MKKIVFILAISLVGISTYAQDTESRSKEKITKYVTTFPNGDEAITITDNSKSTNLELASSDNFYKYEILETSSHELVHGESNRGNACAIDKSQLEEGTYTLKVYTDDFIITSDITIGESES
ncbi:MAG: hypothetical protein JSV73_10615 [Flavobacteriaceae bacterium]|nr:MAG: hypothetical protein JSV73_10615 [Flavobacteriaceae bacterium]